MNAQFKSAYAGGLAQFISAYGASAGATGLLNKLQSHGIFL